MLQFNHKRYLFAVLLLLYVGHISAQFDSLNRSSKLPRVVCNAGALVGYTTSMVGLYHLWYKDYPRQSFRFFNDGKQWLGMDKAGHFYSAYYVAKASSILFNGCYDQSASILKGVLFSAAFLTSIEVFDGFSSGWGFSIADFSANTFGVSAFFIQAHYFKRQILTPKFSFAPTEHANLRPDLLGHSFVEQLFKNYNGQKYWLSLSAAGVLNKTGWINGLGLSLGYGATGLLGGKANPLFFDASLLPVYERRRVFCLALDYDLSSIPTSKKWLKTTFQLLNAFKIPLPGLVLTGSNLEFKPIVF